MPSVERSGCFSFAASCTCWDTPTTIPRRAAACSNGKTRCFAATRKTRDRCDLPVSPGRRFPSFVHGFCRLGDGAALALAPATQKTHLAATGVSTQLHRGAALPAIFTDDDPHRER